MTRCFPLVAVIFALLGCVARPIDPETGVPHAPSGTVAREIRRGMTIEEVEESLGEPTSAAHDQGHHDVWTYDSYAQDYHVGKSGALTLYAFTDRAAKLKSTKRVTIVVTFDSEKRVRDISHFTRIVEYPRD